MSATVARKPLNAPDLLRDRKVLLSLTVLNIIIYVGLLIPLPLFTYYGVSFLVISVWVRTTKSHSDIK